MERLNILGVCKIRWIKNGDFTNEYHRIIYSGGDLENCIKDITILHAHS